MCGSNAEFGIICRQSRDHPVGVPFVTHLAIGDYAEEQPIPFIEKQSIRAELAIGKGLESLWLIYALFCMAIP